MGGFYNSSKRMRINMVMFLMIGSCVQVFFSSCWPCSMFCVRCHLRGPFLSNSQNFSTTFSALKLSQQCHFRTSTMIKDHNVYNSSASVNYITKYFLTIKEKKIVIHRVVHASQRRTEVNMMLC